MEGYIVTDTTFIGGLLYELSDYILTHPIFRTMKVYISRYEVIQGVQCPCVSFETASEGRFNEENTCIELKRPLNIYIHTDTTDNQKIIKELSLYEEEMIKHIDNGFRAGLLWDKYSAHLKPSSVSVRSHWTRNAIHGQNDEGEFHSNIKVIGYDLIYKLK